MQRRDFIKIVAAGAIAPVGRRAHAAAQGWREFEITYRINIKDSAAPVRLWVPVPQDALDYQRITDLSWRAPVATHVLWEGFRGHRSYRRPGWSPARRARSRSPLGW
jgi:hypothetical protein